MSTFRRVELLVHNISHSDIILDINNRERSLAIDQVIARPKFSHFRNITESLYKLLSQDASVDSIADTAMYDGFVHENESYRQLPGVKVPVGFRFNANRLQIDDKGSLRFRRDDRHVLENPANGSTSDCFVDALYFPLMAILLPQWQWLVQGHQSRKIVILITGRGTPMDKKARMRDNSTIYTAMLLKLFMSKEYPDIEVIHQHSTSNLFRYDDNVIFVRNHVKPIIDKYRNDAAEVHGARWKEYIRVSIAFADGSSARISAIQASLRHYRPQYFHFWQLKTFWSECKICFDDIECHSYEVISAEPAIDPNAANADMRLVLDEMAAFRREFQQTLQQDNDIENFWLRKSGKPVLAVLLVKKPGQQPCLYRGKKSFCFTYS
jgi:hypothetical protein